MAEDPSPQQHISGVSTQNHSQAFVGLARDVYFSNSEDPKNAFEQAASACRSALYLTDPTVDRERLISAKGTRVAGTCEWITHNESYRAWLDGGTRLLWISGGPGKGKTVLSVFLTEELETKISSAEDTQLLYYFCSHQDEKRNTAVAVLQSLVYQIVTKRPKLVKHALPYFETPERTQQTLSSLETLWLIFSKLVGDADLGTMLCVLDGLDECDESTLRLLVPRIVRLLAPQASSPSVTTTFRLAIVSREVAGLQGCVRVKLDPDNNEKVASDIERFIAARVGELSRIEGFNEDFRTAVQTALLKRAEGTFLWVGFAMHELSQKQTCSEVLEALKDLPSGLTAIYSRMLLQIPPKRREISSKILRWVTMGLRPLLLEELSAAVGVHPSSPLITSDQAIRDAITMCGPFLKIQRRNVSLVHQSAREYLLRKEGDSNAVLETFRLRPDNAHLELARMCFNCVAQSDLQHTPVDIEDISGSQESPLLRYAVFHWPEHAKSCSALAAELFDYAKPFFWDESPLREHWWANYEGTRWRNRPTFLPLLHIACYLGILPWVEAILAQKSGQLTSYMQVDAKDKEGDTALHWAAFGRNEAVVQLLVNSGADVKAKDNDGDTALHLAARGARGENNAVVQLLIESGADVKAKNNDRWTALHSAALGEDEVVVQLLMHSGADVKAEDNHGDTALHLAAEGGFVTIVQLLVSKGADINAKDLDGQTALHRATCRNNVVVVQQLVSKVADVLAKDEDGKTALDWAAWNGNDVVVRLLIDKGADVMAKDNYGKTALHSAAWGEDEAMVRLLLESGLHIADCILTRRTAIGRRRCIGQLGEGTRR